jgi:hypothetical protein
MIIPTINAIPKKMENHAVSGKDVFNAEYRGKGFQMQPLNPKF